MADYEAQARSQVERSWGVANPGQAPQPTEDEAKKREEAIAKGDTVVGLHALMDDDPMMQGRL
jgi:hypothetical protein